LGPLLWFASPLVLILAGSVSLGEEKALGVTTWQLSLPAPALRFWVVKLCVASVTGLVLGLFVPIALSSLQWPDFVGASIQIDWFGTLQWVLVAWLPVLLGFWAACLLANTIRAVLAAVIALAVGGGCVVLGSWGGSGGQEWQTGLLTDLMTRFQMSPDKMGQLVGKGFMCAFVLAEVFLVALLLRQSFTQFRRLFRERRTVLGYSLGVALLIFSFSFWEADLFASGGRLKASRPQLELESTLQRTVSRFPAEHMPSQVTTSAAMLQTDNSLSEDTKRWLRNSFVTIELSSPARAVSAYTATVHFPGGEQYQFDILANAPIPK
jgi:hypothetical protein